MIAPITAQPLHNIYCPDLAEILQIQQHTVDVKSMRIRFCDEAAARSFTFRVGQFGMFSVFGLGEATFNICSSSTWTDYLEFCFRRVGKVTDALWSLNEGDVIGVRGPYGNGYPMEAWRGKNLLFLGGGIAMPPIRCAIWYALENRQDYGHITIIYGARTVGDLVFRDELDRWAEYPDVRVVRCVDPGGQTPDWKGEVGFVPAVLERSQVPSGDHGSVSHRPADHDQADVADPGKDGPDRQRRLHQPGKPHEMRPRQMRPLQLRPRLRLQGRARVQL